MKATAAFAQAKAPKPKNKIWLTGNQEERRLRKTNYKGNES
jgi:hypothetical protein